jgi:hypothetical protein
MLQSRFDTHCLAYVRYGLFPRASVGGDDPWSTRAAATCALRRHGLAARSHHVCAAGSGGGAALAPPHGSLTKRPARSHSVRAAGSGGVAALPPQRRARLVLHLEGRGLLPEVVVGVQSLVHEHHVWYRESRVSTQRGTCKARVCVSVVRATAFRAVLQCLRGRRASLQRARTVCGTCDAVESTEASRATSTCL